MEELNTPIDASIASWLSDLEMEMDGYKIFPEECDVNFLDVAEEEFLSQDIASVLSNTTTDETSFDLEKPSKLLKTAVSPSCNNSSSTITKSFSPDPSPSCSISSFHSQILSFDNPNSSSPDNTTQFYGFDCAMNPPQKEMPILGKEHFPTQTPNGSSKNQNLETKTSMGKRSKAHAEDHIMAERKRREMLSKSFIALAALIPGLKKMDKASVLRDAIKYVKELKERLAELEEQSKKTGAESVVVLNKPELCSDDDSSSCDDSIEAAASANGSLFQVEARVSGQEILLRIHCQKQKGLLVKILTQIQSLNLFAVNSSAVPFGNSILDITIVAQVGEGYNLTIKDLVKNLRQATLKFMS